MSVLSAATLVADAIPVGPGWVELAGDRIAAVGAGAPSRPADVDLGDAVLVPGFVDMHVHGGAGAAFPDGDADAALRAVRFHRAHGSTTMVASLVTAGPDDLLKTVDALAELVVDGELAGVHLEGPWLAAGRCGAHDPHQLRDPDPAELDRLLRAGNGAVRMVTLAPERVGGLDAVRRIVDAGAVAALGHTDASYALTREAIEAGARVGTHLFNAMAPVHHREPGPAVALLEDDRVTVELVTDGLHVHPALWEHVVRSAGTGRVAAVTDAMAAAGMPDGQYHLGAMRVAVTDGVARLAPGSDGRAGAIAGSTATADTLFAKVVRHAAVPRAEALRRAVALTSTTPARTLGLPDIGAIAPGRRADLVVLDPQLRVRAVYRAGSRVDLPPVTTGSGSLIDPSSTPRSSGQH
ncbi:N-acetylglucosamine-6-phosphate deacetylase [Pseudonocardia kunmingensis]|uniref:N-acetylglucosamine 6-phosphate deacetylase n=1 Tax=Pseudonocardia kunmingensis TaxID=630975 RepID=A0A543D3H8_9PSEU|nr:N-acetylglucosamine-6-phosphate deacetylase [Pseudonocardia kunmingensis]TQM03902.1 N-acetylglucosamine 6-phosphate deacetylase [Pseudonocardia kunmingensis]